MGADDYGQGWKIGYEDGYHKGYWAACQKDDECGRCLNVIKPYWKLLPGYGIIDLLRIAIEKKSSEVKRLSSASDIENHIDMAIIARSGFSMINIGEEEAFLMAKSAGEALPEVRIGDKAISALPVSSPKWPEELADRLSGAIKSSDITALPVNRMPNILPVITRSLLHLGVDLRIKKITSDRTIFQLLAGGAMSRLLLKGRPPVMVLEPEGSGFSPVLAEEGVNIVKAAAIDSGAAGTGTAVEPNKYTIAAKIAELFAEIQRCAPQILLAAIPLFGPVLLSEARKSMPVIALDIRALSPTLLKGLKDRLSNSRQQGKQED